MGATFRQALAATATLMSLAFALSTLERWLARKRPHEAAWTVSLFLFAAGSLALSCATAFGWRAWSFRAFYLFGGVLNVPFLALGTVYLLGGPKVGRRTMVGLSLVAAFAAGVVAVSPILHPVRPAIFPTGKDHFGVLPRVFAGVGSGLAAIVIIGGALWSAAQLLRKRTEPGHGLAAGRLVVANVLIAIGTIVISAKGAFESLGDDETAFAAALAVGISIIFAGFLLTNTSSARQPGTAPQGPPAIPAAISEHESPLGDLAERSPQDLA